MNRAPDCDTAAREATIDGLITLLLLRHSALLGVSGDHPHREIIRQARDNAQAELKWRMLSTVGLLDWWNEHRQYTVGFAPSGDWAGFNREHKTCYAPTVHECIAKLQVMHKSLARRDGASGQRKGGK
jgi:hypothetical protein